MCVCARACNSVRVCVCVRCGPCLICCLCYTITFLLSDRVSRHTRDRARQCALETGDGARAPKPSASFTDRELFTPLEITRWPAFLLTHTLRKTETWCEKPALDYFILRDSFVKIGYEARSVDGQPEGPSLALFFFLQAFKLERFSSLALRTRLFLASRPHHLQTSGMFRR